MSILHIVSVCERQRGTKEVETVSLQSKCIFGQKQNKSPLLLLPLLPYRCVCAPTESLSVITKTPHLKVTVYVEFTPTRLQ